MREASVMFFLADPWIFAFAILFAAVCFVFAVSASIMWMFRDRSGRGR